jgi:uncharacterized glyoxalase superfamily protein PhnB
MLASDNAVAFRKEGSIMAGKVTPIPEGFHTLTPHLTVRDCAKAIDFYKKAFGAEERMRALAPDGRSIMHASLQIGNSMFMLNDEFPDWGCLSPLAKPGAGVQVHMYVNDVDRVWKRAVEAGATEQMPLADQFWGDRYGTLKDPFGHVWALATHIDDPTPDQMKQRMEAAFGGGGCGK